jgi:group I intron endonuclease
MILYNEASIYWIHLVEHTDIYTQGYVGVSKNMDRRINDHIRKLTTNTHTNPHLKYAFNKYGWEKVVVDIFWCGEEKYCYVLENTLRPSKNIGWNITIGGHRGPGWPKGKKQSEATKKKAKSTRLKRYGDRKLLREEERRELVHANKEARKKKNLEKQEEHKKAVAQRKLNRSQESLAKKEKLKKERLAASIVLKKANSSIIRPICNVCNQRSRAISYYRPNGKIQYRSRCENCIKRNRSKPPANPRWATAGYVKKIVCERCGFRARWSAQLLVFHLDANLNNTHARNLKTICQNCVIDISKADLPWRPGDLSPDA